MQWVKNICRLCGQMEENSYSIFSSDDKLEEKIKKCLNFEVYREDFKPKQVCKPCNTKLDDFSNFIDVCYATNLKFESAYYTEPWHSDRMLYEPLITPKQSVIVSNNQRQSPEPHTPFYQQSSSSGTITILPSFTLNQSETMLDFAVNYNSLQPDDIRNTCFNELDTYDKQDNTSKDYKKTEETINSCLVNENNGTDLLDCVDNQSKPIKSAKNSCQILKNVLVSVEDVRKSLETHSLLETRHLNLTSRKSYACPHCEKIFMRRSTLNAHISVHTKIRPYKCSTCSKTFAVKCHLTQHKKIHLDIFVCQICHKNFDVPSKLSRHIQTHSTNRPFMCTFSNCKKKFSDKNNLKQHNLLHSLEKNFGCVTCMKEFKTKKNLKAHIKSHISNGTFQCKFCQKFFKYKHNLKTHLLKHTNEIGNKKS